MPARRPEPPATPVAQTGTAGTAAAAAALAVLAACSPPPPAPSYPPGTVLAVGGLPIAADEVDRTAAAIGELFPGLSEPALRRAALAGVLLPRAAVRATEPPERRERALAAAREARERLLAGEDPGPGAVRSTLEGDHGELGLELWCLVRGAPEGQWLGPLEGTGRFLLLRIDRHEPGAHPPLDRYALSLVELPYLDGPPPGGTPVKASGQAPLGDLAGEIEERLSRARLEIVDPEWRNLVPARLLYLMRTGPE